MTEITPSTPYTVQYDKHPGYNSVLYTSKVRLFWKEHLKNMPVHPSLFPSLWWYWLQTCVSITRGGPVWNMWGRGDHRGRCREWKSGEKSNTRHIISTGVYTWRPRKRFFLIIFYLLRKQKIPGSKILKNLCKIKVAEQTWNFFVSRTFSVNCQFSYFSNFQKW